MVSFFLAAFSPLLNIVFQLVHPPNEGDVGKLEAV